MKHTCTFVNIFLKHPIYDFQSNVIALAKEAVFAHT